MRFRKAIAATSMLALAVGVAGCGSSSSSGGGSADGDFLQGGFPAAQTPAKGGTLRLVMNDNIDCWNGLSYYGNAMSIAYFTSRGLYGYPNTVEEPQTDQMQPDLAAAMPTVSADGKTYTVKLRKGLTFPDGSPVTAKDVKATFEYMMDPNIQCATGGPPASGYYASIVGVDAYTKAVTSGQASSGISGIKAVDDLTTTFTLTEPDGSFPRALAMAWAFIRPASTPRKKTDVPPPSVGPYRISDYQRNKLVTIVREPTWKKNVAAGVPETPDENNVDQMTVRIGVPEDTQLAQLKNNSTDISFDGGAPLGSQVPAIANDPQYQQRFFSTPDSALDYLALRTDKAPFDNLKLRQAVNHAIDRDALVKITGGRLSRSSWTQLLPQNLLAGQPTDLFPMDVEKARQLVKESGMTTPIEITLANLSSAPSPQLSAALKEQLEAVGFSVNVKALSPDVYYGYTADKKNGFDVAWGGWGQDYGDAITFFKPLLMCGQGSNYGQFCSKEFDAAVNRINLLEPGTDRTSQFAQLSTDTAKAQTPWATLALRRKVSFISDRVGNYIWGPGKQFYFGAYFIKGGE